MLDKILATSLVIMLAVGNKPGWWPLAAGIMVLWQVWSRR